MAPQHLIVPGILADGDELRVCERAADLAARLGLAVVPSPQDAPEIVLTVTPARLELRSTRPGAPGAVYVDFAEGASAYGLRSGGTRLLYRAVGFRDGPPRVIDATAGLGEDAFLLAWKGCTVTAIERSPIVAALLEDGLRRARAVPHLREAAERVRLAVGDARTLLQTLAPDETPDVVYLDPMFPHRSKSALVKKEMRVLRSIVGDDPDAGLLFDAARAAARRHVVVKRMRLAPPLAPDPTRTYEGKSTRYDVYSAAGSSPWQ